MNERNDIPSSIILCPFMIALIHAGYGIRQCVDMLMYCSLLVLVVPGCCCSFFPPKVSLHCARQSVAEAMGRETDATQAGLFYFLSASHASKSWLPRYLDTNQLQPW